MKFATILLLAMLPFARAAAPEYFTPSHRVAGIGVARDDISDELLELRANLMIESQTFSIMREPDALAGARRITGNPKLQALFRKAGASGMPASVVEAISYLES